MFYSPLSRKTFKYHWRKLLVHTCIKDEGGTRKCLNADRRQMYGTLGVKSNVHTVHSAPLPNPASPESVRTGDILFCISFEIISYNRWVLFSEPASQSAIAPRALMAPKTPRATELAVWSNSQLSAQWKAGASVLFIHLLCYFLAGLVKHQLEPVFLFLCFSCVFLCPGERWVGVAMCSHSDRWGNNLRRAVQN